MDKITKPKNLDSTLKITKTETVECTFDKKQIESMILTESKRRAGYEPYREFEQEFVIFNKKNGSYTVTLINPKTTQAKIEQ